MKHKYKMYTKTLTAEQIWAEFEHFINYFTSRNMTNCKVLFGYHWGMEYYSEADWQEEDILLIDLVPKVRSVEEMKIGNFSEDDLFIYIADLVFNFCHESDIHLEFGDETETTKHFLNRWQSLGFTPHIKEISIINRKTTK